MPDYPSGLPSLLATVVAGLLGLLLNQVAFAPLRKRSDSQFSGLISSIAMAIIFEAAALGLFGARSVRFPVGTVASPYMAYWRNNHHLCCKWESSASLPC